MITSKDNKQIKNLIALREKAKERRNQDAFLVEGTKMVEETPEELLLSVFVSESYTGRRDFSAPTEELSDSLFKTVCDTQTPQGILAIVRRPHYELADLLKKEKSLFLILEDVQDPGNLGTMVRTAEGAGATGIIMSKNTVDLFNPKTVRSTMGSIYRVPFVVADDLAQTLEQMKAAGVKLYAAHLKGQKFYDGFDYTGSTGFLIGNEGNGLSKEIADAADTYLLIPMEGRLESLNAAVSAALLMYECHRQRGI